MKNPDFDPEDPESTKRIVFNNDLFKKFGGSTLANHVYRDDSTAYKSVRESIEQQLPHLVSSGELRQEDFRQVTLSWQGNESSEIESKQIKHKYVMFGGVRHYVGNKFDGCYAKPLNDEVAIIYSNDSEKIVKGSFSIVRKEEANKEHTKKNGNVSFRSATSELTQPRALPYDRLVPQTKEGLSGELREHRIRELQRYVTGRVMQLMEVAEDAEALVRSELPKADEERIQELAEQVRTELLEQAKRVVELTNTASSAEELKESLETLTFDARAYVALLKSAGVESMTSNPLQEISANDLNEDQKEQMVTLMKSNYEAAYADETDQSFKDEIAASLEAAFENKDSNFYLLEDEGRIVSFNRFDSITDDGGRKLAYFGSFNADAKYRGVGSVMLERTIQEKIQSCDAMFAHCDPTMSISQKYIEDGFVATQNINVAGKESFEIWRSADVADHLETKKMSTDELAALAGKSLDSEADYFVREVNENDAFEELDESLPYLLTRYFTHEGKTYVAFEINTALSKQFVFRSPEEEMKDAA